MAQRYVKLSIHGKVQGVGFRYSAIREAQRLGINGWIKNEADGSVSAEAYGEKGAVDEFIKWCWQGPPAAQVRSVEISEELENVEEVDKFNYTKG
ncbi:MAG: acylphosphatase, partial [Candidatus Dadabacteria bacterium]